MNRHPIADRSGAALILLLMAIAAVAIVLQGTALLATAAIRSADARGRADALDAAARGAVAVLSQRLAATAAERLGDLDQADLGALNAGVGSLPAPAGGASVLAAATGIALVEVRDLEVLPYDEEPLELWTDQLRRRYTWVPPVGGRTAARTLKLVVYATVLGTGGERRSARRTLSVSRVPPHQDAIYAAGAAELCADPGTINRVGGSVRVDGLVDLRDCGAGVVFQGSIAAAAGVRVTGTAGLYRVQDDSGETPLTTVLAIQAEQDPDAATAPWHGRVRIPSAVGARMPATLFATATVAGSGECLDFDPAGACAGAAAYHPSLRVRGSTRANAYSCGAGYGGASCAPVLAALTWTPWPFAADPGNAAPDPADPDRLWHGLYPDPRAAGRCSATVAGSTWRTFRCPTNPWGWTLDAGALPALPGGVLSVARSKGFPPAADPNEAREVLMIRNGRRLAGPLTIHSQLPVVIVGSFNVETPKPALIVAPRITVLPNEADDQLRTTAVWDSVAATGGSAPRALPLVAASNVTIYAVLRMGSCGTVAGQDFGGVWRGAPAVVGDWSRAGLRIVGAVEVTDESSAGAAWCGRWGAALNAPQPSGTATLQPRSREVLFDSRLLYPAFQPPGSWSAANVPSPSAAGVPSRTPARQAHAIGGTVALRLIAPTSGGPFTLPSPIALPAARSLPSPAPPLP